jgi:hypothetical protein
VLDEARQRREPEAEEGGRDLGVEEARRTGAALLAEDLEILLGRMADEQTVAVEHGGERLDVDRERIDHGDLVRRRHLEEGELRKVGLLAMELGIERNRGRARKAIEQGGEVPFVSIQRGSATRRG